MSFSLAYRWADDSCLHGGACTIPLSVLAGARNALRIFATSRTRGPGSLATRYTDLVVGASPQATACPRPRVSNALIGFVIMIFL